MAANQYAQFHRTVNGVHERQCANCGKWLPQTDVHFHRNNAGFFYGRCKPCARLRMKAWAAKHADRGKRRPKTKHYFYAREVLTIPAGIARAVTNGVDPALVLQRVTQGWGRERAPPDE